MLNAYRAVGHECFEAQPVADMIALYEQAIECHPDDGKGYWDLAAAHGAGSSYPTSSGGTDSAGGVDKQW